MIRRLIAAFTIRQKRTAPDRLAVTLNPVDAITPEQRAIVHTATFKLNHLAESAMTEASVLDGDTRTDVINRALQIYALWRRCEREGAVMHAVYPDGSTYGIATTDGTADSATGGER